MAERTFSAFLQDALAAIAIEAPLAQAQLVQCLGSLRVSIDVDHDRSCLAVVGSQCLVYQSSFVSEVAVRSSREAIGRLLDGSSTLLDELLSEGVGARGRVDHIVVVCDALLAFFRGAVRSPSVVGLLERYLAQTSSEVPSRTARRDYGERL